LLALAEPHSNEVAPFGHRPRRKDIGAVERDRPFLLDRCMPVHLPRNLAPAIFFAQMHEDADRRHPVLELWRQLCAVKAALEFFGDEVGRQLS
jgi:hypothetical protein